MENAPKFTEETGNEPPAYDFSAETYLNPETNAEKVSVDMRYKEMFGDVLMEKVLRPNMTDEEIEAVSGALTAEYEQSLGQETGEQEMQLMAGAAAENQEAVALDQENKISPLSRAIEILSEWMPKHKKAFLMPLLAGELAGCAGGNYYVRQGFETTIYSEQQQMNNSMYSQQQQMANSDYEMRQQMANDEYYAARKRAGNPAPPGEYEARRQNIQMNAEMQRRNIQGTSKMQRRNIQMNRNIQLINQGVNMFLNGIRGGGRHR